MLAIYTAYIATLAVLANGYHDIARPPAMLWSRRDTLTHKIITNTYQLILIITPKGPRRAYEVTKLARIACYYLI